MENLHNFQFFTLETLIIQTFILALIIYTLNKFIFKPYLKYLDELEAKQEKLEKDYLNIDKLIADAEERKEGILEEARTKGNEVIANAKDLASKDASKMREQAEAEAKNIVEASKNEVEKERLSMLEEIRSKVADLSLKLNKKLFDKETVNKDFMEKGLAGMK